MRWTEVTILLIGIAFFVDCTITIGINTLHQDKPCGYFQDDFWCGQVSSRCVWCNNTKCIEGSTCPATTCSTVLGDKWCPRHPNCIVCKVFYSNKYTCNTLAECPCGNDAVFHNATACSNTAINGSQCYWRDYNTTDNDGKTYNGYCTNNHNPLCDAFYTKIFGGIGITIGGLICFGPVWCCIWALIAICVKYMCCGDTTERYLAYDNSATHYNEFGKQTGVSRTNERWESTDDCTKSAHSIGACIGCLMVLPIVAASLVIWVLGTCW
jgi:hypothetical protein